MLPSLLFLSWQKFDNLLPRSAVWLHLLYGQCFESFYKESVILFTTIWLVFLGVCEWATTDSPLSLVDWPQWETSQMCFWSGRLNLLLLLSTAMASATPPKSVMNGAMVSHRDHKEIAAGTVKSPAFFYYQLHNQFLLHLKKISYH